MNASTFLRVGAGVFLILILSLTACDGDDDDTVSFTGNGGDDDSVWPDDDSGDDDAGDDDAGDDDTADDDDDDIGDYAEIYANGQVRAMVHAVSGPLVYAADQKSNEVIVLDTEHYNLVDTIPVGSEPVDIDLNPEGTRLWVATKGTSAVSYVDLTSKAAGTVNLNHPPVSISVGGNGKVYVPNTDRNIEIIDEATQTLITEVDWGGDPYLIGSFIEIDSSADLAFLADTGSSPSTLLSFDVSNDDLDVVAVAEFGSLGSNGLSLSLAPDGETIVYPCGSGNGDGYTVAYLDTGDFSNRLGTFDIGTYPKNMVYDPAGVFIAGINADPYDKRIYVMNPANFNPFKVLDATDWLDPPSEDPPRNQDMILLGTNADGSVLILYAEDTYNDLEGYFYMVDRAQLGAS